MSTAALSDARLVRVSQWREHYFPAGSRPDKRTVRKAIDNQEIPGCKVGGIYYVDVFRFENNLARRPADVQDDTHAANPNLIDKVLSGGR